MFIYTSGITKLRSCGSGTGWSGSGGTDIVFRRPSNAGASNSLILLGKGEDSFQTLAFWEVLELLCQLSALSDYISGLSKEIYDGFLIQVAQQ